jgi:hypothetical protein
MASVIISSGLRDFLPSATATKESIRFDEVLTNSCRSPPNSSRIDIIVQIYYKRICGVDFQIKHEQKKLSRDQERQSAELPRYRNNMSYREPILTLYRNILRTHKKKLAFDMRSLGDEYVRSEFKSMKKAKKEEHVTKYVILYDEEIIYCGKQNIFGSRLTCRV